MCGRTRRLVSSRWPPCRTQRRMEGLSSISLSVSQLLLNYLLQMDRVRLLSGAVFLEMINDLQLHRPLGQACERLALDRRAATP